MKNVQIWTDGGCSPNPGPGGWGVVLMNVSAAGDVRKKELSGCKLHSTNNEMELTAMVNSIKALKEPCSVIIRTDSQNAIGWLSMGWKCKHEHLRVLIAEFKAVVESGGHNVEFAKVKAHSGDVYNERADTLAVQAREEL